MQVKQISIFMENRPGRMEEITGILEKAGINIRALSLADTSDFGILRLIVDKPEDAAKILHDEGFTLRENVVIACEIDDKPGGLHKILKLVGDAGLSIEYMYGFLERYSDKAIMILRVEDADKAITVLVNGGITLIKGEQIYAI